VVGRRESSLLSRDEKQAEGSEGIVDKRGTPNWEEDGDRRDQCPSSEED